MEFECFQIMLNQLEESVLEVGCAVILVNVSNGEQAISIIIVPSSYKLVNR
jgi:hypothetical protein